MIRLLPFIRTMAKAAGNGSFLPGRAPPQPAPGGTADDQPRASTLARLQNEHRWYGSSRHWLVVPGLTEAVSILHLTDVHIRQDDGDLSLLCHRISQARPDLVAVTGDVVTRGWTEAAARRFLSALPPARLGRFAVLGNWEHWVVDDLDRWRALLAEHGVTLLHETWADLGPLTLAGTDDALAGSPDPDALLAALPAGRPAVVLTHSPVLFPRLARSPVRLVLSGHSHGGQVRLPLLGAVWAPRGTDRYLAGWYTQEGAHLFVSRGLGWSVAPVRLNCPPELAWIRLTPDAPAGSSAEGSSRPGATGRSESR